MEMTEAKRESLILSAVGMAGPVGDSRTEWTGRVNTGIKDLLLMLGDRSDQRTIIDEMTQDKNRFVGTIVGIELEKSSQRAVVGLYTGVTTKRPNGVETIRTNRLDSSQDARDLANYIAEELIGHRVLAFKYMEVDKNDSETKYRKLVHVVDLGESNEDIDIDELEDFVINEARRKKAGAGRY